MTLALNCSSGIEPTAFTGYGFYWLPFNRYQKEHRDGPDAIAFGKVPGIVHIYLVDIDFPFVVRGNLFKDRGHLAAWPAPVCIEVHDCRPVTEIFPLFCGKILDHGLVLFLGEEDDFAFFLLFNCCRSIACACIAGRDGACTHVIGCQ